MSMQNRLNDTDRGKQNFLRKTCPVPLCPPQIQHGLAWNWTWASVMRDQQPLHELYNHHQHKALAQGLVNIHHSSLL